MEFTRADKRYIKRADIKAAVIACAVQILLIVVCTQIFRMRKFAFIGYIAWSLLTGLNIFLLIRQIFLVKNYSYRVAGDFLEVRGGFAVKTEIFLPLGEITAVQREPIMKRYGSRLSKVCLEAGEFKVKLRCVDELSLSEICAGRQSAENGGKIDEKDNENAEEKIGKEN